MLHVVLLVFCYCTSAGILLLLIFVVLRCCL
uniref:Uncharacterized protein n=1 Tax=Arundo donax TaxID=35708 RepID=A0A0A9C5V1_ARUDO